ncbi:MULTISPECIES: YIP1 family protein [Paracoccus]|uniref:YIP1 family protein n=1 Tax=Paracoccus litorisediminis TaxID=2006130 RepID=A0A844HRK7_9RHOB|nr:MULTISPECIES: YIP1 family protein [Paracoccus]MBD9528252.1 YIP1 family protein [Paracoccus sp. PAR01]MTH60967.1 YIP1 family protein [Paracoccus litorisediminis]
MKFGELGDLVVLTLRTPERAVRLLRDLDFGMAERWMIALLAACLSSLLAGIARQMFPPIASDPLSAILSVPLTLAGLQFAAMVLSAVAVTVIGRAFGGKGEFADALVLVAWVELILVGLQAVQLVLMLLVPPTATLMSLVAFGLSIYLTIALTKALHGFTSTPKVALGFIGGVFLVATILSILAAAFGILPEVSP